MEMSGNGRHRTIIQFILCVCVFFKYIGKAMLQRGNTEFSETSKIGSFQYRNLGFGANFKNPRLDPIGICGLLSFF